MVTARFLNTASQHCVVMWAINATVNLRNAPEEAKMPRVDEATRVRILTLVQEGRTRRSIAAEIGCALGTVTRIVCAFREEGRIRDMEREGRPRRTMAEEYQWIIAAVCCDPSMTAAEIREELGLQVSLSTIRKRLHAAGLRSRVACQRPLLTQSHKHLRLEFATNHLA